MKLNRKSKPVRQSRRLLQNSAPRLLAISIAALSPALPAAASWLDSDYYCRVYGCVVVHDGFSFDVYDNYIFATGQSVPANGKMIPWSGNPFEGNGDVNPVITGTRTEGLTAVPLQDEGMRLGIDTDGDGTIDFEPTGGSNSGFLDASDALNPFTLNENTDLVGIASSAQRSFYVSSRTDFYLSAEVFSVGEPGPGNSVAYFDSIDFDYQMTTRGEDDGMEFGANAMRGKGQMREIGNIQTLRDLYGGPVNIMEFRKEIRRRDSASLPSQSVRFDYTYGFEDYDLSMGAGRVRYRIEFDFYNR